MHLVGYFDGAPMTGVIEFAVSKGGDSFSVRVFLTGESSGAAVTVETLMIGHRTGACEALN